MENREMRLKLHLLLTMILVTGLTTVFGEVYLRYNYLGYNPVRKKRMVVMATKNIAGQKWSIKDEQKKEVLSGQMGKSVCGKGDHTPMAFNCFVDFTALQTEGRYTFETNGAEKAELLIVKNPYRAILDEPLHWMRAARCGSTDCVDHKPCHFGDTSCAVLRRNGNQNFNWQPDAKAHKYNVVGGWHDAGDYLKFTLTIGYATYFLLHAYEVNPAVFEKKQSKTDLVDVLDEARWGLEFLMRTMPDDDNFVVQVGDYGDHNIGLRLPENDSLDGKRPCLMALSPTQMGYAAASLALGSQVFESIGKKADASRYATMAEKIYHRAVQCDTVFPAWYTAEGTNAFYNDNTVWDNLELAAAEMYRLTKKEEYLKQADEFESKARNAGWRAWETVNMPAHLRLLDANKVVKNDLVLDLDEFMANSKKNGNIWGVPLKYVWGGLYAYIGIGAGAMEYQLETGESKYESLSINMLDYLLGVNNWGICFVATPEVKSCIRHPFSQVYTLQSNLFPLGAISEGPGDKRSHDDSRRWFSYDVTSQPTYPFNTNAGVFYDHQKDFMCMETTIAGVADGIFMLALATKVFSD
jgi:hypothetical protein